jgi:chemotaxis receptor (MCP) glutamine deamidase CheD
MLGGANVLSYAGETRTLDIGARNAAAVQEALEAQKVSVCATELGGKVSRTVRLWVADGRVMMKTLREGQVRITVLGDENGSRARKRGLTHAPRRARPTARAGGG